MLTRQELTELPDEVVELWQGVQTDIFVDIAKRLKEKAELIPSSVWKLNKLKDLGATDDMIAERLAEATEISRDKVNKIMSKAVTEGLRRDIDIIRKGKGVKDIMPNFTLLNPILSKYQQLVNGAISNYTDTFAGRISNLYSDVIDQAYLQVTSGYLSRKEAMKLAVESLFNTKGLPDLVNAGGRTEQLTTVVARALRTGTNQAMARISIANATDLDCDLVEVSEHMDARPEHAQWQGQIYSLSGKHPQYPDFKSSTDYGSGDGLCGWNCRHTFWPYFDGVDLAQYREVELQRPPEEAALERDLRDAQKDARVYSSQAKVLQAGGADSTVATRKANEAREAIQRLKYELDIQYFAKKVPTVNDDVFKNAVDKAIYLLENEPNTTREDLIYLFPEKTKIGVNPISGKDVYVLDKAVSWFINKHIPDGSLRSQDIKNMNIVFNYDVVVKEFNQEGDEVGLMFIKKAPDRKGYFDGIVKTTKNGEELFHFQYRKKKEGRRLIRKKAALNIVVDSTIDIDSL